jgi:hypothetical protein
MVRAPAPFEVTLTLCEELHPGGSWAFPCLNHEFFLLEAVVWFEN